jgi:hypothetical protein
MNMFGRSMAMLGIAFMLVAGSTGCSVLGGRDDDEAKGRLGMKADRNPFTGEQAGRRDERTDAQRDAARTERARNGEVSSEDMAREQAERRNRHGGGRVNDGDEEIWFGMSSDGGFLVQYIDRGDPNDYGLVQYATDDDGNDVLGDDGKPVVEEEHPPLIVFRALSTTRPLDPDRLEVYTRGKKRVIRNFTKVELPDSTLDREGRDADGFLGADAVYVAIAPEWFEKAVHNTRDPENPRAPAVRDLPAMNFFSSAAAEFYGDERQGWLYVDEFTLGPESEDMGESTNELMEWTTCRRPDGTHCLRLWATDRAANRTVRRRLVQGNVEN